MEAEDLPELIVLDELGDDGVDAAVALEPDELRRDLDHAPEVEERGRRELGVALVEDLLGVGEELHIAVDVAGALVGDLLRRRLQVVGVVEGVAVLPVEPVERHHRQQRDVVRHVAAGGGEDLFEARRRGDDGRPAVEGVALVLVDVGPPPGLSRFSMTVVWIPAAWRRTARVSPPKPLPITAAVGLFHLGSLARVHRRPSGRVAPIDQAPQRPKHRHRRFSGQHSDLVGPFQPAGVETPDERIGQAVEALEDPVAPIRLGGAEEHPVEQPVVAGAAPVVHRPLPGQVETATHRRARGSRRRHPPAPPHRAASIRWSGGKTPPASHCGRRRPGRPARTHRCRHRDDGQDPGFLPGDLGDAANPGRTRSRDPAAELDPVDLRARRCSRCPR